MIFSTQLTEATLIVSKVQPIVIESTAINRIPDLIHQAYLMHQAYLKLYLVEDASFIAYFLTTARDGLKGPMPTTVYSSRTFLCGPNSIDVLGCLSSLSMHCLFEEYKKTKDLQLEAIEE